MPKTAILLLPLALTALAQEPRAAAKHVAFIGGSGDPPGPTTLFDSNADRLGRFVSRAGYAPRVAFDGGHTETERVVSERFPGVTREDFTQVSYRNMINHYVSEIRAGRITSGDQLMVVVSSHGAQAMNAQVSHSVSAGRGHATNLNSLAGSETVSLDNLQELTRLAEERGIKLAVLDFSCHSGASLGLANSKTCVITAAGPQSFGYGGNSDTIFSNAFLSRFSPGRNLEDIFHEARSATRDLSFPMISAGAGREVGDQLYPLLRRYQYNYSSNPLTDKFQWDVMQSVATRSCETEPAEMERIIELSRSMEEVLAGSIFSDFRFALREYAALRQRLQQRLLALRTEDKESVCFPDGECMQMSRSHIVTVNPETNLANYRAYLANSTSAVERQRNQRWVSYFENWVQVRNRLLQETPGLASVDSVFLTSSPTQTYQLAQRVSDEGRKLYSAMVSTRSRSSNPCRDFTL